MSRLLSVLLFALSIGLSPLSFAANPVEDDNYTYNGKRYIAKSTGGVKKGIRLSLPARMVTLRFITTAS